AIARYRSGRHVVPTFCSHREINHVLATLRCEPSGADHEVWITDISWTDPAVDRHLQDLIDHGVMVYWIDHHRTALERFDDGKISVRLTDSVLDESHAASRLVFDYLGARHPRSRACKDLETLIAMADDND